MSGIIDHGFKFITKSYYRDLLAFSIELDKFLSCECFEPAEIIAFRDILFSILSGSFRGFSSFRSK